MRRATIAMVALGWLAVTVTGCDEIERELQRRCQESEATYNQALADEETELAERKALPDDDKRPAHFGLTLSNNLLSNLANVAVEPVIKGVLEIASTVEVGGQSVDLETDGDIVDLTLASHDACDHCFRVGADLGGGLIADIPGSGRQRANLNGTAQLVVPLILTRGDEKSSAVKLDFRQLAEIGASNVVARIDGIDRDWEEKLRGPLSDLILRVLDRELKPVTLVEFDGPSFGLKGFELAPVALTSDGDNGSVFAGFSANVAALNEESIEGVEPVTDLGEGQDIALSFQPKLVVHLLSLLIGDGKVARQYTNDGEASESGDFHVTLDTFNVGESAGPPRVDAGGMSVDAGMSSLDAAGPDAAMADTGGAGGGSDMPVGLEFQVHNFNAGGFCFSAGARMFGGLDVTDGDLQIGIDGVRFTSDTVPSGLVDIANWTSAQFIQESRTLVDKSLDGKNLTVPGTSLNVGPLAVGLRPNTVVLRGATRTDETSGEE